MKRILASLLLVAFASSAWAKDICVSDSATGQHVFRKVKGLKPGGAIPLTGFTVFFGQLLPLTGTAVMSSTGSVRIGVMVHAMSGVDGQNGLYETVENADATFAGSGVWDNGDHDTQTRDYMGDQALTWTSIDCSTVVIP